MEGLLAEGYRLSQVGWHWRLGEGKGWVDRQPVSGPKACMLGTGCLRVSFCVLEASPGWFEEIGAKAPH